jgi:NitT/TauT family transport system substrate-binding protein/sulfonate transport system substrate-binding protein
MKLSGNQGRAAWRGPLSAAVAAAIAIAACGSSSGSSNAGGSSGSDPGSGSSGYTLNVGYIGTTGLFNGPEGFAYSKGVLQKWLAADGITIKLSQFANGPLLTAAMTGGSVDIGIVGDTPALIANSHGLPAKMINQGEVDLPAWIIAKKGGATSVAGLAGETVGRPQGSYIDRYLQGLLAQKGLTSKVHLTSLLPPQAIPAAESGAIDAVALPAWEVAPIIAKGGVVLAKSETTPSIEGTEVTIATTKTLSAHPKVAAEWDAARRKAVAYSNANPAAFYAWEAKSEGITGGAAAAKSFLPLSDFPAANYTASGLKMLQGTLNFLVSEKEASAFSINGFKQAGT